MIDTAAVSGFFVGVSVVAVLAIVVLIPKAKECAVRAQVPGPGPQIRGGSPVESALAKGETAL